jgi:hypothetical protein
MIFSIAAARIIPALFGRPYDRQNNCCQDHSCVRWNMIFGIAAAVRIIPALVWNMIVSIAAARIIPALYII